MLKNIAVSGRPHTVILRMTFHAGYYNSVIGGRKDNTRGREGVKVSVVADSHGHEILEASVCLQGHTERGYTIFKDLGAGFERVENNFSDGTRDRVWPRVKGQ
jgi:hypothetical protein